MAVTIKDLRFSIYLNNSDAKKAAIELQTKMQQVAASMDQLRTEGKKDSAEYRERKKTLDELTKAYEEQKKQAGLLAMSTKELRTLSKTLKQDLDRAVPDSKEWKALNKDLEKVQKRYDELKASGTNTGFSLQKMATGVSKYWAAFTVGAAVISAVVSGLWSLMKNAIEFSKAVSEMKALTGATGADLDYLKEKAKELGAQYGKSATEIVEAMKLVGSAKPELLENVVALGDMTEAVITLSKATGMDLGVTTTNLATIMNQFGKSAGEANDVVNVLAAGSKYGAKEVDYLSDAISKSGTVAKSANVSLEQNVAVMELFGEKGVMAETAGNGFKRVLVELQKDTKNYTNGLFDINKAIDNNQKISGNNIALQKKFGSEFFNLAQILFQNKERFNQLTQQVTGTTVAEEQMAAATDNLSGDIDKMKGAWNAFILSLEDGQGPIAKAFRNLINWTTDAVDGLSRLNGNDKQNEKSDIEKNTQSRVKNFKQWLSQQKDKQTYINQEIVAEREIYQQNQKRMLQIQHEIQVNKELGGAWADNNKALSEEYDGLGKSVRRSISYVNALGNIRQSLKQQVGSDKKTGTAPTADNTEEMQRKQIAIAMQKLENDNLEAITSIKKRYLSGDIKSEYDYNQAILKQADDFGENRKVKIDELMKVITDPGLRLDLKKQLAEIDKDILDREIDTRKKIEQIILDANPLKKEQLEYDNRLREAGLFGKDRKDLTAEQLQALDLLEKQHADNVEVINAKSAEKKLTALDKELSEEQEKLSQRMVTEKWTEAQFKDELIQLEIDFLRKKLQVQGLSAEQIANVTKQLNDKLREQTQKGLSDRESLLQKYGLESVKSQKEAELAVLKYYEDKGTLTHQEAMRVRKIIDDKYFSAYTQKAQDAFSLVGNVAKNLSSTVQNLQSIEESKIGRKYDKQIKAAQKAGKDTAKLEEQKEEALAKVRAKYADKMFALTVASIVAETAVAAINAYASGVKLGGVPVGVLSAAAAVAYGASQIAVANEQRQAAKEGYFYGGYTGGSNPYEVRGALTDGSPVHGEEFVVNHKGTRNPSVRRFTDVFNMAQKNGTIHMINTSQILEQARISAYNDSRSMPVSGYGSGLGNGGSAVVEHALAETYQSIDRLNKHLDDGIKSYSVISGDYGTAKQIALYDRMKSNVSRK